MALCFLSLVPEEATGYATIGAFGPSDFLARWDSLHDDALQVMPDHVQTGIAVGRGSTIAAGVCMGSGIVPGASVVRASSPRVLVEPRCSDPPYRP